MSAAANPPLTQNAVTATTMRFISTPFEERSKIGSGPSRPLVTSSGHYDIGIDANRRPLIGHERGRIAASNRFRVASEYRSAVNRLPRSAFKQRPRLAKHAIAAF